MYACTRADGSDATYVAIDGQRYYRTGDVGEWHQTAQRDAHSGSVRSQMRLRVVGRVTARHKRHNGEVWCRVVCVVAVCVGALVLLCAL
jgi:hypothetical protein